MGSPAIFSGKRTKLLTTKGILNSDRSIIDNDGILNYIKNGHAEVNALGWATYADAAGVLPVDGIGGTPTHITFTQTTTTPLGGLGSFLVTNSGTTSSQGEGASYNFTIDAKDKGKVLLINFDYIVNSGTFVAGSSSVDSDLEVYIYDVTNASVIQPSNYKLLSSSTTIADKFAAIFQTSSTSTSYRLILHCPTTATAAWSIKLDNVTVAANDSVTCRYSTIAGQSIASGATSIVNFDTKDTYDSHGAVTTGATWKFTAPISGKYKVSVRLSYNTAAWTLNGTVNAGIFKNNSNVESIAICSPQVVASYVVNLVGSDTIQLLTNDFIDIRTNHNEATARSLLTSAGFNYVSIERVGN